jgi:hypothetical protein
MINDDSTIKVIRHDHVWNSKVWKTEIFVANFPLPNNFFSVPCKPNTDVPTEDKDKEILKVLPAIGERNQSLSCPRHQSGPFVQNMVWCCCADVNHASRCGCVTQDCPTPYLQLRGDSLHMLKRPHECQTTQYHLTSDGWIKTQVGCGQSPL